MTYDNIEFTLYAMLTVIALWVGALLLGIWAAWKVEKKEYSFWAIVFITIGLTPLFGPFSSVLMFGVSMLLPRR